MSTSQGKFKYLPSLRMALVQMPVLETLLRICHRMQLNSYAFAICHGELLTREWVEREPAAGGEARLCWLTTWRDSSAKMANV